MQKYQDVVLSQNGNPIAEAEITVTDRLGTPVPVYASNGVGLNMNPVRSSADGRFFFYAPDGRYNLVVRFGGNIMATVTDILLEDPKDGSDAVFNDVTVLGEVTGNVTGNAGTVTNGVYTTGDQTIAGVKTFSSQIVASGGVQGNVTGNAGTVTNGVYTTGDQTIAGVKTFSSQIVANGGVQGNVTGNANTATALQTARTINGVSFNGSADITLPTVNTAGDQTIGGTKTFTGGVLVTGNTIGLGYGTGAGGTVTQATSKSTAITLNRPTGQITMNNEALAANTTVSFNFNNSLVTANDTIAVSFNSPNYNVWVGCTAGVAVVYVRNISGGSLSEALGINFTLIKGATS